ncbi:regulator of nonsense transcripts 2 [Pseudohyphozyma bogoriensis]|nr:regulator of nonsense transcripts 2 [Pseudohyphozyma bogoriensis]
MDPGEGAAAPPVPGESSASKRTKRALELRAVNRAAWDREGSPDGLGKLDTSLKRHTALLTKLRSSLHTPATVPGILKDVQGLALEKYIEEAVGAVVEGVGKCKNGTEVAGAVEVISALHQRFPTLFTTPFTQQLVSMLKPSSSSATDKDIREKEDAARVVRQRGLVRLLGELEVVDVVRKDGGAGKVGEVTWGVLKELLTADKDSLALAAPLGIAFAKHLGALYLPPVAPSTSASTTNPADFPTLAESAEVEGDDVLIGKEMKERFRKLLVAYLEALTRKEGRNHLVRSLSELQKQDKRNHEAYIRSGEVFEDREKNYEKSVKAWERGWASVNQLSEVLGLSPPTLPSLTTTSASSIVTGGGSSFANGEEIGGPGSLWADEEDKKFYEDLRDLRREVPASILGVAVEKEDGKEDAEDKKEKVEVEDGKIDGGKEGETVDGEEEYARIDDDVADPVAELENPIASLSVSEAPDALLPSGPAAQLTALLARLQDASSIASIDAIAVEFAFLNSKAARKRLVKFLGSVHRNRQDILPYYSRLVGTLDPYMPDIGKDLIALLEEEFRYLQRKKNVDMAETRSKNLRFLSELTKFGVTPVHSILHVFKVLLDDFSGPNIDNLCTVLESCGRFLLRSEATSEKMKAVLETMKRKKGAMNLDQRQVTMLENAYYQCDPPDRPIVVPKERTPMQLYIRHLFYNALTRNSSDRILKLVRKLHWEDPAVVAKLHSAFTKVWKIKYSNVHLFAVLLYDLGRYHPEFNLNVIDEVLENVRAGMEINSFKYNQQRIATIKYLGELYNYRVVDSRVIFDTLWSLVTFGHPDGRPWPDVPSPIDSVDDCFRVRLVCTLLDTCGSCFERGALRKKLDNFLVFFQMYALSKGTLPMDVDFMYSDTFEQLRPSLVLFKTFGEAVQAVDEMMAAVAKNGPIEDEPEEAEGVEEERRGEEEEAAEEGEAASSDESGEEIEEDIESEPEESTRGKDPNAMTQEEEDDFSRELAKMMVNAGESRKAPERKPAILDVGVPFVKRVKRAEMEDDEVEAAGAGMKFTLLTKKGNKQQTFSMEIPKESSIAIHTLEKRAQAKVEQQELKRRVLDYEEREEVAEKQALKEQLARRGVNLRFVAPRPT